MKARLFAGVIALLASFPAYCEKHALLMLIGEYQKGIPALDGTKVDVASARLIATEMGVAARNIHEYTNGQLTLAGLRKALDDFDALVRKDDQVFIYYSGHGARRKVVEGGIERCGEALVSVDGDTLTDAEFELRLKRIAERASKLIVLADSCHSGGLATRSVGTAAPKPKLRPKSIELGGDLACHQPVNVLTRGIAAAAETPGKGGENYVFIAAARDNEVSFDTDAGGLATTAWRDCISGAAKDKDGSGGLTAEEVEACAQEKIAGAVDRSAGVLPHHVSIVGNKKQVLKLTGRNADAAPVASSPIGTLHDIYNSRDDRRTVELRPTRDTFKIGQDDVQFNLRSSHAGYVYLLMVGSDGTSFDLLFPNQIDRDNQIKPGETLQLPRASWMLKARGPAGKNHLLALVTESPRDFTKLGMKAAGPFSILPASISSAAGVQSVTDGSSQTAGLPECSDRSVGRTLEVQRRCSNAYGAGIAVIEESR